MKLRKSMVHLIIVAAISMSPGLPFSSPAYAAGPCKGDIARYCRGARGPKQVLKCLKQNRERLSPRCKLHIRMVMKAAKGAYQDCEPDIYAFCPDVRPGGRRIIKCLRAHKTQLTPQCKAGILNLLLIK